MEPITHLLRRDDPTPNNTLTPLIANLLIALIAIVGTSTLLLGTLYLLRSHRKKTHHQQQQRNPSELPLHNPPHPSPTSNSRRLTIFPTPWARKPDSVFVQSEKQAFVDDSSSPPCSPVPEIRITFPDEEDRSGNRKSGGVVVVRISEKGAEGFEPCGEETLPRYRASESERFQSLDLERMGGLKEKSRGRVWSWGGY